MDISTLIPLIVLFIQLILFAISMFYVGQKVATKDDIRDVRNDIGRLNERIDQHLEGHP